MPPFSQLLDRALDKANGLLMRGLPGPRLDVRPSAPLVSFTFDDVPETAWTHGAAILERHGVHGTFYISGGLMDRREPDRTLISANGCRQLAESGHEIGCHTFTHRKMRTLGGPDIDADLTRNAAFLDGIDGGKRSRNFAYPYNAASFPARDLFRRRFRTCRAGGDRINRGSVNPACLYGMEIRQPESDARALTGRIDELVADPGWLVFFTHDITETPTPYGCTPATFEALVTHALDRGCTVLPVGKSLDSLQGSTRR